MLIKVIKFLFKELKKKISPLMTIIKNPHVQLTGNVFLNNCKISREVKIYDKTVISNAKIGSYTYVGGNSKIMNTRIGKFCSLGPNLKIGLGIHPTNFISTYPGFYSKKASGVKSLNVNTSIVEHKKITIKNDVWIGDGVTIVDGITIGNGAVIASGAVVTKNVPDYAIVGGVPAKVIKFRFTDKEITKLNEIQWWNNDINQIKEKASLFLEPNKFFKEF
jgi:acetyltransferase-like isoleucine patch superfamily enzyme